MASTPPNKRLDVQQTAYYCIVTYYTLWNRLGPDLVTWGRESNMGFKKGDDIYEIIIIVINVITRTISGYMDFLRHPLFNPAIRGMGWVH